MIYSVGSGYFTWSVTSWAGIFMLAALICCALVFIIVRRKGVTYINEIPSGADKGDEDDLNKGKRWLTFRKETFDIWLEWPPFHAIAFVLLLLFALISFFGISFIQTVITCWRQ